MSSSSDNSVAVEIARLEPSYVDGLIECVRRCYGETYPDEEFYDAAALSSLLDDGRLRSWVALAGGRVVGHIGIRLPLRGDWVAETVGGIVDPAFRGRGLLRLLGGPMSHEYATRGLAGMRMAATTAHARTQTQIDRAGGVATGVFLGHIPADIEYLGIAEEHADKRLAAIAFLQLTRGGIRPPPLRVHLPGRYREAIESLYRALDLERTIAPGATAELPEGFANVDCRRGAVRFEFVARSDARAEQSLPLEDLLRAADESGLPLAYADVLLADSRAAALVEHLRAAGFRYGALLPGSAASEVLRLQRLDPATVAPERAVLGAPQVESMMAYVLADWRSP